MHASGFAPKDFERWMGRDQWLFAALVLALFACGPQQSDPTAAAGTETGGTENAAAAAGLPKLLENLGPHHHAITTKNELVQRYFDQGLILTWGFNHAAAVNSFDAAAKLDPDCAMCLWGVALALGPNINAPMGPDAARRAYAAVQEAQTRAGSATPKERALIAALSSRYAAEPPEDRAALDLAYANEMGAVSAAYPDDIDVAVLYAESLMDLYPWDYWTSDGEPREHTARIIALLEQAMESDPRHVGANHLYIHAVEEFFPEKGVAAADRLGDVAPDAGHLVHMPSHIYWRVGRYNDALEINQRAAASDEAFFAACRAGAFYQAAYYPHNVHFLWAAAATEGRSEIALTASRKLAAVTRDELETFPFMEEFQAIPILTLARFGRWDAVLGEPQPAPEHRYLTGIWHYARGLANVRKDQTDAAATELDALRAIAAEQATQDLILAGGTASASSLLGIAVAHLEGELAAANGDREAAVKSLARAVELQDTLVYMEPPPWYFPTRQAYGAVLLEAGRAEEAEAVYRADLDQYPSNGWSLFGLTESLRAQDRDDDASIVERGFQSAWARADVELEASRF